VREDLHDCAGFPQARWQQQLLPPNPSCSTEPLLFTKCNCSVTPKGPSICKSTAFGDPGLIIELGLGYAPGGNLRRQLAAYGYSLDRLSRAGLINAQGGDAFCRRVIFPCHQQSRVIKPPHAKHPDAYASQSAYVQYRHESAYLLLKGNPAEGVAIPGVNAISVPG
jgi:hypothetical protein